MGTDEVNSKWMLTLGFGSGLLLGTLMAAGSLWFVYQHANALEANPEIPKKRSSRPSSRLKTRRNDGEPSHGGANGTRSPNGRLPSATQERSAPRGRQEESYSELQLERVREGTFRASSLDLTNYAVSPRRAAAARKEMTENETEDEWQRRETDATGASPSRDPTRPPSGDDVALGMTSRPVQAFMGPADRSNTAAREYVAEHAMQPMHMSQALTVAPLLPSSGSQALVHYGPPHLPASAHPQPPPHPPPAHTINTASDLMTEGKLIEAAAMQDQYCRVVTPEPAVNEETEEVCTLLKQCYDLRRKWLFKPRVSPEHMPDLPEVAAVSHISADPFHWEPQPTMQYDFEMQDGVIRVWSDKQRRQEPFPVPGDSYDFFSDMSSGLSTAWRGTMEQGHPGEPVWCEAFFDPSRMCKISAMGPIKSFCHHRLMLLEQKFNLHVMLNADKEFLAQKTAPHRDFYNVRKVDTHVHHSACMHQKHLLRFIKSKLRKEPDEVVIFRDGKYLTLREVFESLKLTGHDLNVDTLDMHADKNIFHRFDRFNLKYNPCGQSRLREIFIKQDNILHGRFLAELTQEVLVDMEASKYQHAEYRISIYGRKRVEWDMLAAWYCNNRLYSDNVLWLIQIPRLYNVYKEQGLIDNFEQLLDNIFHPLFEVTRDPNSHPQLHLFLKTVVGLDMVDDESRPERRPAKHMQTPREWNLKHNPAYSYYAYYVYANLYTLNKLREARGLNTIAFRPHAGEAGDTDHVVSAFMLCENIAHGITLRKSPCIQYLFYLAQVGLCMSPLSNNSLFLDYHRNPFPTFFARGLSISLSTDDPLQIHLTKEPLVEEYSVAAQVWKLSATDLCEIARNSVTHSGFPHQIKMHWVHKHYWKPGPDGNDIHKTNVPNLRMRFRYDCHTDEMQLVMTAAAAHEIRLEAAQKRKELAS